MTIYKLKSGHQLHYHYYPSLSSSCREVLIINYPRKANHNLMTCFDYNPNINSFGSKS